MAMPHKTKIFFIIALEWSRGPLWPPIAVYVLSIIESSEFGRAASFWRMIGGSMPLYYLTIRLVGGSTTYTVPALFNADINN